MAARRPRIAKPKNQYHHGDLRRALLDASLVLLARDGVGPLTLREVARLAGVTHAAPYRHFPSKEALLAAVAEEGFRQMREEMVATTQRIKDPAKRLHACNASYVAFATAHPAHFRVMFSPGVQKQDFPPLQKEARAAFELLVESVVACQKAGLYKKGDPMLPAVSNWSICHGISMLLIDGQLNPAGMGLPDAEKLADWALSALSRGLTAGR